MIEVFDKTAATIALARRMLGCSGSEQPLRLWGHARERTVRDTGGTPLTIRPNRALCTGCGVTHVMLNAGLLPRRDYDAGLIGQALAASLAGTGTGTSPPAWPSRPARCAARSAQPAGPPCSCASRASAPSWHPAMMSCCPGPAPRSWVPLWSTWGKRRWYSADDTGCSTLAGGRESTC